jgi:hypothetical protein
MNTPPRKVPGYHGSSIVVKNIILKFKTVKYFTDVFDRFGKIQNGHILHIEVFDRFEDFQNGQILHNDVFDRLKK